MNSFTAENTPIGVQNITLTDASQKLTAPTGANAAFVQVQKGTSSFTEDTHIIRYNYDENSLATVNSGLILGDLDYFQIQNIEQLRGFNFTTAQTGVFGTLYIQYFHI